MGKFITIKNKVFITVIVGMLCLTSACRQKQIEKTQNHIPNEVIAKCVEFILLDKRYSRRISSDVRIEKNYLVQDIKPFKIGKYTISMIDSTKVTMEDSIRKKNVVFNIFSVTLSAQEGLVDLNYVLSFGLYVNLTLEKKAGQWIITKSESFYI